MADDKPIQSIETTGDVTTITYEDGTVEIRSGSCTIQAGTISGGVRFGQGGGR